MMDKEGFAAYLKRKRKTEQTTVSCLENAERFEAYLSEIGKTAANSAEKDLDDFISSVLQGKNVARFMWTLQYYFVYIDHDKLLRYAQKVREMHTAKKRQPFKLKDFKDVSPKSIEKLASIGILSVDDMLKAGKTTSLREELAEKTSLGIDEILELAKLSNLTRLGAVKSVRARLYHDSGFDTIEKISKVSGEELRRITSDFIERTGFEGIPPTPKEADNTVKTARELSDLIEL